VEGFGYFLRGSAAAHHLTNHGLANSDVASHTFANTMEHGNGAKQFLVIVFWAPISVALISPLWPNSPIDRNSSLP
jgi:hypothetical protein